MAMFKRIWNVPICGITKGTRFALRFVLNPLKPFGLVKAKSIEGLSRQRAQYGADPTECSDKSGLASLQIAFIYYAMPSDECRIHTEPWGAELTSSPPETQMAATRLHWPYNFCGFGRTAYHKPHWTSGVGPTISIGPRFYPNFLFAISCFYILHSSDILCVMNKIVIGSQIYHMNDFLRRHFTGYAMSLITLTGHIFNCPISAVHYFLASQHKNSNFTVCNS
jgi:hypothetical protein